MQFFDLKTRIDEPRLEHVQLVHSYAHAIAQAEVRLTFDYALLYIKKCPKWLPDRLYRWILSNVLELAKFKINDTKK